MMIHKTKADAMEAIKKYASVVRELSKETGVDFVADALDDSGMEYYLETAYRGRSGNTEILKVHFQELDL